MAGNLLKASLLFVIFIIAVVLTGIIPGLLVFMISQGSVISSLRIPVIYVLPLYLLMFPLIKYLVNVVNNYAQTVLSESRKDKMRSAEPSILAVIATFAASTVLYPLFAGAGFATLTIVEKLLGAAIYSASDKSLFLLAILGYMVLAIGIDAANIGRTYYGSAWKGISRFLPLMLAVGIALFVMSLATFEVVILK